MIQGNEEGLFFLELNETCSGVVEGCAQSAYLEEVNPKIRTFVKLCRSILVVQGGQW